MKDLAEQMLHAWDEFVAGSQLPYTSHHGSVMATRAGLTRLIGERASRIHPKCFHYYPIGRRVIIAIDEIPKQLDSSIHVPEGVRKQLGEQLGAGVVFACGATVGKDEGPHPGAPLLKSPADLLYQHVLFSGFAGQFIGFDLTPRPDAVLIMQLTDRDLWILDTSPPSEWEGIG